MKRILLLLVGFTFSLVARSENDWAWWNDQHGWEPGMPSWRTFLIISSGYLGPNALPVPEVKKGIISLEKEIEFGTDFHFMSGDNAQNLYGKLYMPFAEGKVAVELYGVFLEHYSMSDKIRDERKARDRDGEGLAIGDLYFSTLIQLSKDRRFPNTVVRLAGKTASGGRLDAARYSDSPGYFFDFSFSKPISNEQALAVWTPFASAGFYSWQTNDDENLQNDAYMYAAGIELDLKGWQISNSVSGYSGYKEEKDSPMTYNFELVKKLKKNALRFQLIQGLRDWEYTSIKLSYIWKWK